MLYVPGMRMPGNIFLIGPMGSGKSTIGRQLATALKKSFFDSDHEIEAKTGVKIPVIFEMEGESGFRAREQQMIATLSAQQNIVLATGGGVILNENNRKKLRKFGCVIYLRCSVERQLERTLHDKNRPLLQTENPREKLLSLIEVRAPLYEMTADFIIDTGKYSVKQVVNMVIKMIKEHQ